MLRGAWAGMAVLAQTRMLTAGSETPQRGPAARFGAGPRLCQPRGLAGSPEGGVPRPGGGAWPSRSAGGERGTERGSYPRDSGAGLRRDRPPPRQAVGGLPAARIGRRETCSSVGDCCAPGLPQEDAGGGGGERPLPGVGGRGGAGAAGAPGSRGPHGRRPAPRTPPELAFGPPAAADARRGAAAGRDRRGDPSQRPAPGSPPAQPGKGAGWGRLREKRLGTTGP